MTATYTHILDLVKEAEPPTDGILSRTEWLRFNIAGLLGVIVVQTLKWLPSIPVNVNRIEDLTTLRDVGNRE
jgi:hypothetical protein